MKIYLKIARSAKTSKVYACYDLGYTKIFINLDDAVKLTGISYNSVRDITVDKPLEYEINLQAVSK